MNAILLVATWKAVTIPILCVIGVLGFLVRALADMTSNWETGYGPGSKRATFQAFAWLIIFVLGAILIGLFAGCSHLTVAPKPVVPKQIAFSDNVQNAGLIDCDKDGCLVTPAWIDRYHKLETEFKSTIYEDSAIKQVGSNYRVTYAVNNHYAELRASERGP